MPKNVHTWLRTRDVNVTTAATKLNSSNDWTTLSIMNNSAVDAFGAYSAKGGTPTLTTSNYAFKIPANSSEPTLLEGLDGKTVDVWAIVSSGSLTLRIEEFRIVSR